MAPTIREGFNARHSIKGFAKGENTSAVTMQNPPGFNFCNKSKRADMAPNHSVSGFARGRGAQASSPSRRLYEPDGRLCRSDITAGTAVPPVKSTCPRPWTVAPRLSGAALPFVLIILALNVVVIVAMLAYATTEYQASRNSVQAESARALAQSGIDLAAGLISANSINNGFVTYQRVTNVDSAWRLETRIANVAPTNSAQPWKTAAASPAVLHSGFATGTNGFDLNYAADATGTAGFIAPRTNLAGWTNLSTNMFRMDWIYVYRGSNSDPANLIGRIAYWVDDESSKLNVNYSGDIMVYSLTGSDAAWTSLGIPRTNLPASAPTQVNFHGRKWPLFLELGGVAEISRAEAMVILSNRLSPTNTNFRPFPSVLGLRIATNSVGRDLHKQSSLAFTATIYSREEERTHATGRKRLDLLNVYQVATNSVTNDIYTNIVANYPGTNSYSGFDKKYDLRAFSAAAYYQVQWPGFVSNNTTNPTVGTNIGPLYTRGLPQVDEFELKAVFSRDNGTNVLDVTALVDLRLLNMSFTTPNMLPPDNWAHIVRESGRFSAEVSFQPPELFGMPVSTFTNSGSSATWFTPRLSTNASTGFVYESFGPGANSSPPEPFKSAMAQIAFTNSITNTNSTLPLYLFPTNIVLRIKYNNDLTNAVYQEVSLTAFTSTNTSTNTVLTPGTNQTNVVHYVSQPKGDDQYRGDPRFGVFASYMDIVQGSTNSNLKSSTNSLNTNAVNPKHPTPTAANWRFDVTNALPNTPDLVNTLMFFGEDRGIPMYIKDKRNGFGPSFAGIGWIGEVPVTTASGAALAWSTPRLWGDGRSRINGVDYPPDWLLLDCFHIACFPGSPQSPGVTDPVFSSYGKININTAKYFFQSFQPPFPSTNKTDTILDSIFLGTQTRDFDSDKTDGKTLEATGVNWDMTKTSDRRTNFIGRVTNMISARNGSDTPYTTPFEFLADLAATNLPAGGDWWMAPNTSNGSIYTATNTTDRRIEGVIRSLVQKLTTHGNQFTIFSLGQALQPSASGTVDVPGGKANVVGEAYLQAVYERAPQYNETTGAITNGSTNGAPPMRQLFLRELR